MFYLVSGINSFYLSSSTSFWYQFLDSRLIYSCIHHFFLVWLITLLIHNSLSFTPGLKLSLFTNPTLRSFTSSSGIAFTIFCPDRFFWATRILLFVSPYFFVSVLCARLSWLSRPRLSARKYTVSYYKFGYLFNHFTLGNPKKLFSKYY